MRLLEVLAIVVPSAYLVLVMLNRLDDALAAIGVLA